MAIISQLSSQRPFDGLEALLVLLGKINPVPTVWGSELHNPVHVPHFQPYL